MLESFHRLRYSLFDSGYEQARRQVERREEAYREQLILAPKPAVPNQPPPYFTQVEWDRLCTPNPTLNMPDPIAKLPNEVLEYILLLFGRSADLMACSLVCKRWRQIIFNDLFMRKKGLVMYRRFFKVRKITDMLGGPAWNVALLGARQAGKTAFAERFAYSMFSGKMSLTDGASYYNCVIEISFGFENHTKQKQRLDIWEINGGTEDDGVEYYLKTAKIALIFFDPRSRSTFDFAVKWLSAPIPKVLVALFLDEPEDNYQVSLSEAEKCANSYKVPFAPASSKTGEGINGVFSALFFKYQDQIFGKRIGS